MDIHFLGNFSDGTAPRHADVWDWRKGLGWTGAVASVLSGAAIWAGSAGAANFWNPVGWTLLGFSVLAGLATFFVGKKAHRMAKEKEKAKAQLHDLLKQRERKIRELIVKWLQDDVGKQSIQPITDELTVLAVTMTAVGRSLQAAARLTQKITARLNARLLSRIAELGGIVSAPVALSPVARCRGLVFRAVCEQATDFEKLSELAAEVLAEDVRVLPNISPEQMLKDCLAPLQFERIQQSATGFDIDLRLDQIEPLCSRQSDFTSVVQRIIRSPLRFHPAKSNE